VTHIVISQVKSSLRLFRPPLTQTQRGLQDHSINVSTAAQENRLFKV